ncbi:receptor-type tyrosine-protein phosphatase eta isoform X2 [Eleginops maclovinus]|uniref:receptor-type tyrosine-protein phosphatase eta isoform X2 n=1 Tax=Eleginops maclovinus TaxID=56733 RepID=UPI003080CAB6
MKPLLHSSSAFLWSLFFFCALLKVSRAECRDCDSNVMKNVTTTTTTVTIGSNPNCNLSIEGHIRENGSITGLIPGAKYQILFQCFNCCKEATTKPEKIRNLNATAITTSSISVIWFKPEGNSSCYRVQWINGGEPENDTVTETQITISNLTAGVQYDINVSAVANDGLTEGQSTTVSQYTKPGEIRELTVFKTTSSISLNWNPPPGEVLLYRVKWDNGGVEMIRDTKNTSDELSDLIPGTSYSISIIAFAGDNQTHGDPYQLTVVTKPEVVRNLNATAITTSSIFVMWIKPEGNSSCYRVQWINGGEPENDTVTETQITISNLTAGVQYDINVSAVANDGLTEGQSTTVSQYTKPGEIRELTVFKTTSSISLNWNPPPGEVLLYRVKWDNGGVEMIRDTKNTSDELSDLIPGTSYNISIIAFAGDNQTHGDPYQLTVVTKPEVVRNLNATAITTSSIFVMWIKPEGNSSCYRVQWINGGEPENDTVTETQITISNLTAGVQYDINVTAVANDDLTEGQSTTVSQYTKPGEIRELTVFKTTSSISLNWNPPPGEVLLYRLKWDNGGVEMIRDTKNTSDELSDLIPGTSYNISIIAFAGDNQTHGDPYQLTVVTKPEVVRNLNATAITTSSIFVMWIKPEGNSSCYRVQWINGGEPENDTVTETQITISNLTAGVQYDINVTAVANDDLTEGQSTTVSQYTKPGEIRELTVSKTTSSISLNWNPPPGEVLLYRLKWDNGGVEMIRDTKNTSDELSDLIPGTSYSISIIAFAGDNQTHGDPYQLSIVTEPAVVRNLSIIAVTHSSVSLAWIQPEGSASSYLVQWTAINYTVNNNTTIETNFTINNLTSGVQYNITVFAVAEQTSNKGVGTLRSAFTRPEKPENIRINARGTMYLTLTWMLHLGRADHYVVKISNERYSNRTTTAVTTATFTYLFPGRLYNITVTAVAGNLSEISEQFSFATEPIPPGSIIISQRTNSSLLLEWDTPLLMSGAPSISYNISYQRDAQEAQNQNSLVNHTELSFLLSGTFYNISVQTVGPQSLESTAVHNSAFTLPNPVLNLEARPKSTTSVKVSWSQPQGVLPYYEYLVQTYNTTGELLCETTVSNYSTDVRCLEPGYRYNINVTTIAAAGSESTVEQTFSYTMPKAVTNLTVEDVNTTAIRLTWLRQGDHKPSYSYRVEALQNNMTVVQYNLTKTESFTFNNLKPGKYYTFAVFTVVEEVISKVERISSFTRPETVSGIIALGSTTNMSVSWTPAVGQVDSYTVQLQRDGQLEGNRTDLRNDTKEVEFKNLTPGMLYCVTVISRSGPFRNNLTACNATFPNPPGPIMVVSQTVESINFTWASPENMNHSLYTFSVSDFNGSYPVTINWFLLKHLQSGSPYNIFVVTVGVSNYKSTPVTTENYTRPYHVTMLRETEITTNSVTLEWEQLENKNYSYVVQTTANGSFIPTKTVNNQSIRITGLQSGSNYSFTVSTQTADGTQAAPVAVFYFTRPYRIEQLEAETLNSSAVRLHWNRPQDYKQEYRYRVKYVASGYESQNKSFKQDVAELSGLIPGTNYTFYVFVMAANGIEGEASSTSQYTKPDAVQPSISNQGSNSSVLVSWTKPAGKVESYTVFLKSNFTTVEKKGINSSHTSLLFDLLSAGMQYSAKVTTFSGPLNASSGFITNATYPNPPGLISILNKTTSSIDISWEEAPLMTNASFQYKLINVSPQARESYNTSKTHHTFDSLPSGTSYNISVATVGKMGFESESVRINLVTTRPFRVKSIRTFITEESIKVMWTVPDEDKTSYRYNVTLWQSDKPIQHIKVKNNSYFDELVPGEKYDISVTTETSDGTKGAPEWISKCTNASPVEELVCKGPNTKNAKLILNWKQPKGNYSGFNVTYNDNSFLATNHCEHTVPNLPHYTEYYLTIKTQSCGLPSTPVNISCRTGITNPPIPDDNESLVNVGSKVHNRFTIQIKSSLLENTNGPITNVGVLVTNDLKTLPGVITDWKQFLGKTYKQWIKKDTAVYLATVTEKPFQTRSGQSHLTIAVGDETSWKGYTNGPLEANGKYQYAIVLFTKLDVENHLVQYKESLVSITQFYPVVELPQDPAIIGIAVGAALGIFCVLFIILIGFIVYWKRVSNKESSDIQIYSMRSVAVRVEDYEDYYKKQKADSNCGFAEEFEDLKMVGTAQQKSNAERLENKPKNRYANVLPYDSSRVKLSIIHGSPYDDYINANYMPGYNSRKEFIAAQGPLPGTVNDFWRMIWEKNVRTLVMLTRCNEQGRVKCEQYWALGTKHFENITVTTTSEIALEDWTIRDFDIKNVKTAETRSVRHFHFTAWPDHGVPQTTELLISFRHLVREHMDQFSRHSPTVVHCSAGVGRTGTLIAIDRLMFQIERENIVDVFGIVYDLRMHRPLMVQTEDQYVFLNQCAMDIIRSRTGTNVDLIYQNAAALSIYENVEPKKGFSKSGYQNA